MAKSKSEVEIEWIKSTLFPEIIKNKHFREDNSLSGNINDHVKLNDVQVRFIGSEEAFMLTTCYRAVITLEEGDSGPKTTTIIVKKTPNLPQEMYDAVQFAALFTNEILTYNLILPAIEKFAQQSLNIPRFYFGELQKCSAIVSLEDFGTRNWRLANQKTNLSLAHALAAVRNLGIFHGTGFAWRHKHRDEFDRLTKGLKESRYEVVDIHPIWALKVKYGGERSINVTRKYQPQIDDKFLDRYHKLIGNFLGFGRKMMAPVEPLVTLCHGDYLRNNIAFKYADSKGTEEPIDSLMFDMQTMRVCSPMLDFATFLCLSTYTSVREKCFDEIFDTYYDQLTTAFKKNTQAAQVPEFLSRDCLLREYWRYLPYTINIASYFLMELVEPEDFTSEDFIAQAMTPEEVRENTMKRGGEEVDRELSHQIRELYELVQAHNLDIFEGFDYV